MKIKVADFGYNQKSVLLSDKLKSFVQFYCTVLFLLLWHDCVVLSAQPDCVSGFCCPCLSRDVFKECLWTSRAMLFVHIPCFPSKLFSGNVCGQAEECCSKPGEQGPQD